MVKTAVVGKTVNGATQLTRMMVLNGDRVVLVDAVTGQPPKKVITKMVDKDLHVFAEGASDPSVIVKDYATFNETVQISGMDASGAYVNYGAAEAGSMELGAASAPVAAASAPLLSTSAMWGIGILAVAGGVAAAAGGGGGDSTTTAPVVVIDPTAPTATITMSDVILNAGETATVTVVFSEAVTGFSNADITAQNGTLSTFSSTDSITWTAIFTPTTAIADTTNVITLTAGSYTSIATSKAGAGATSANYEVDTTVSAPAPLTVAIRDDEPMATANMDGSNTDGSTDANGADILYTFTFSAAVQNFTIDDVVVTMERTDGSVVTTYTAQTDTTGLVFKTFEKVSDTVYTLSVTPEAGYEGVMRVSVATSDAVDISGNTIDASNPSTLSSLQTVDMRAPFPDPLLHGSLTVSTYDVEHQRLVLTFDENLEQVNQSEPTNFGVMINYNVVNVAAVGISDNNVGMADNQVFLYLDPVTNARGETFDWSTAGITVSYADHGNDLAAIADPIIHDLAGNDATSFNDYIIDTLAPDAIITMSDSVLSSGVTPTVTFAFSEAVTLSLSDLDLSLANGTMDTLSSVDGGKTWTGTFTANAGVSSSTNTIGLLATYEDNAGISGIATTSVNYLVDTLAPVIATPATDVVGHTGTGTITLHFNEVLDAVNFAPNNMFYVTDGTLTPDPADGAALLQYAINAVSISGQDVTLTADPSITDTPSATWILTYIDAPGNDALALQDIYGSDVSSFTYSINTVI